MGLKKRIKKKSINFDINTISKSYILSLPLEKRKAFYSKLPELEQKINNKTITPNEVSIYIAIATADILDIEY